MHWRQLDNNDLSEVYKIAIKAKLNTEFMKMLSEEIKKRKERIIRKKSVRI